jgi:hypothetical protein
MYNFIHVTYDMYFLSCDEIKTIIIKMFRTLKVYAKITSKIKIQSR